MVPILISVTRRRSQPRISSLFFQLCCEANGQGRDFAFIHETAGVPCFHEDSVAEWLRRWIANPLISDCESSNLFAVVLYFYGKGIRSTGVAFWIEDTKLQTNNHR
jgi:hypothetical protein